MASAMERTAEEAPHTNVEEDPTVCWDITRPSYRIQESTRNFWCHLQGVQGRAATGKSSSPTNFGAQRTTDYVCRLYWWPKIGREVDKFCWTCPTCQVAKATNKLPQGLLHGLLIPRQPWGLIAMDFMGLFPPSEGHNYLWIVLCMSPHINGTSGTD